MNRALIVVDVQNDFCPGGALAVPKGDEVVPVINSMLCKFDNIIMTHDWHPKNHCSFVENGGQWPRHCVQYSSGAWLHPVLGIPGYAFHVNKGLDTDKESYSGFDNPDLDRRLTDLRVVMVYICGLATDYCVKATAMDVVGRGYETYVVTDACRGVNVEEHDAMKALGFMSENGVHMIESEEV